MTSELKPKPCPFCGGKALPDGEGCCGAHHAEGCPMMNRLAFSEAWNHRPAEAALQDKLDAAVRLLERWHDRKERGDAGIRSHAVADLDCETGNFLHRLPAPSPPAGECGTCGGTKMVPSNVHGERPCDKCSEDPTTLDKLLDDAAALLGCARDGGEGGEG